MTEFEDGLWQRLVEEHAADAVSFAPARSDHRRLLVGGGATATAAVTAAAVIAFSAGGATPAYAMTQNADGSYTFTINDLATAAPELNAKFKQLGIDETVVTASASCPATNDILHELQLTPGDALTNSLTFSPGEPQSWAQEGLTGVVGAEQLPNGELATTFEAIPPADVPSCFPIQPFTLVRTGDHNGEPLYTPEPVTSTTPATPGG